MRTNQPGPSVRSGGPRRTSAPVSHSRQPNVRQTRPDYTLGMYKTAAGLGPVARRGWDDATARMIALAEQKGAPGLLYFYRTAPLQLLKVLMSVHPMAKMAHSNNAAAACSPGDTQIVVERTVTDPITKLPKQEPDTNETALMATFLDKYSGGLPGLQRALLKQMEWSGMFCLEAVPDVKGKGVARAVTFDPLTVYFMDEPDGSRRAYQYAIGSTGARGFAGQGGNFGGTPGQSFLPGFDTMLDTGENGTVMVGGVDYDDDNPYCDPIFGGFLPEGIKDLGQERNLSDILRGVAYPHLMFGFPVEECIAYATANPDILDRVDGNGEYYQITASEYAEEEFAKFHGLLTGMNPDDPVLMPKGTEGKVLDTASGVAGLDPLLQMRRHRGVMGLDHMPNLLGITDGGTQAYAEEQGKQQAKKLEYLRGLINAAIVWLCNLHLRLQGKNLVAKISTQPIRPTDALADAKTRGMQVNTDMDLMDEGLLSAEEVAQRHGTGVVGERRSGSAQRRSKKGQSAGGSDGAGSGKAATEAPDPETDDDGSSGSSDSDDSDEEEDAND